MLRNVVLAVALFATNLYAQETPPTTPPATPPATTTPEVAPVTAPVVAVLPGEGKVVDYLQDISVTIVTDRGEGSGVIKTKVDESGNKVNFVWTAAHVVDNLNTTRTVVDPKTGTERRVVVFKDPHIVKDIQQNGRSVGQLRLIAEVIRYSDAETGHDLALLRVRKKNFIESSVVFLLEEEIPSIGTPLYHVGSLLGQLGSNSMTTGIVSQHGRLISKQVFDQTTVAAFPGSSGGGVYLQNGKYIGMLVRGAGETFNLIVPVRRMQEWAKAANILWAMNDDPLPSKEQLLGLPIEDVGKSWDDVQKTAREANGISADYNAETGTWTDKEGNEYKDFFKRYKKQPLQIIKTPA